MNTSIDILQASTQEDIFEWLPCTVGEALEADRDTYFKVETDHDCDDTLTTHLRGRQLKGTAD